MPQQSTIAKAAPKTPTGASAYLAMTEQGELWTAPSGAVIRIRGLSVYDRATILQLPESLQVIVYEVIDNLEVLRNKEQDDAVDSMMDILSGGEEKKYRIALDRKYELGVHFCIAGWIDPEVVLTPEEIMDSERQIPATRIPLADRDAFLTHVFGGDEVAAAKTATFPEKPAKRVAARPAVPAVSPDAEPGDAP